MVPVKFELIGAIWQARKNRFSVTRSYDLLMLSRRDSIAG